MALFEKREEVFCKRDREGWTAAKAALKAAGIRGPTGPFHPDGNPLLRPLRMEYYAFYQNGIRYSYIFHRIEQEVQ